MPSTIWLCVAVKMSMSPMLKFPTTATIEGNKFYFIASANFDNLDSDKILDPKKLEPVRIGAVELKQTDRHFSRGSPL